MKDDERLDEFGARVGVHGDRRRFLSLGLGGVLLSAVPLRSVQAAERLKSSARIVIAGAGAAGLAAAARLAARLDGAKITLIDARKEHLYQPGYTLVAAGIKPQDYVVVGRTADFVPRGVELLEESVAEFDPEGNRVVTSSGKTINYDYLIVTTGLKLDYDALEGMDVSRIGKDGLGSVYHSPAAAAATWALVDDFTHRGGVGVFCRPATEMKCAGAPLKHTFITEDYFRRRGTRGKAELIYHAHNKALFSVPIVSEKVRMLFRERGIKTRYDHVLTGIDIGRRIAVFTTPQGKVEQPYDFINVIPPMRAPDPVRFSPLAWQTGDFAADGWMEVDRATLRHKRFPNVFGVGDVAGVPKGKTAASVKWQVPVAVDHLLADLAGGKSEQRYEGYTSCPLITRLGRAMLVEFDYENNLVPSFPGVVAPLEELWVTWVMKTMALKPTYVAMLRGRA